MHLILGRKGVWYGCKYPRVVSEKHFMCGLDPLPPPQVPFPSPLCSIQEALSTTFSHGTVIWQMAFSLCPPSKKQGVIQCLVFGEEDEEE